jgi:hypothetical protein
MRLQKLLLAASALSVGLACGGCAAETGTNDQTDVQPQTERVGATQSEVIVTPGYGYGAGMYNPPGVGPYNPPGTGVGYGAGLYNPPGYNPPGVGAFNPPGYNPPGTGYGYGAGLGYPGNINGGFNRIGPF